MLKIFDLVILLAATVALTSVTVWLRDEVGDWRSKRHHREVDRELRTRRR